MGGIGTVPESARRDTPATPLDTRPIAMTDTTAWDDFVRSSRLRPPRELLRRTLGAFLIEGRPPGVAVDLGCGSGPDAAELLRRGWTVHAVDTNAEGLRLLSEGLPADALAPPAPARAAVRGPGPAAL
jgi:SAM-dependent methyltransferase